ncbi:MAG TPA: hypothetical protein VK907_12710, partial [Phnomibacter sp.]|nr:hypothetical protein [Phnomibacter sp.]
MRSLLIFGGFLITTLLKGQSVLQPVAARYLSLGAYSRQFNDVFGARANAASLAGLRQGGIG